MAKDRRTPQTGQPRPRSALSPAGWAVVLLILLAGAGLRFLLLDTVPPGLTHDEANNVYDGAGVLRGIRPLFFPVAQGKEPLYPYSVAGMMALLGPTPFAMRLTTAFWGVLLLAATFTTVRRLFDLPEAFLTTGWLALSFWGLTTSRMGLRAVTLPFFFSLSLYWLHRSLFSRSRSRWWTALTSGVLLGITQYTYLAARVAPGVFVLWGLYFYLQPQRTQRDRTEETLRPLRSLRFDVIWRRLATLNRRVITSRIGLALVTAAVVAAPLYLYLRAHPGLDVRVGMLDEPLRALLAGDPRPLWEQVRPALGMFFLAGDTFIPYNLPGRPLFDPLTGVLFTAGLLWTVWHWRQPASALALIWFGVGVFPALVTGIEAVNLRAILAQPVVYLFPALAVTALARRVRPSLRPLVYGLIALLLVATGIEAAHAYFVTWANDRDVRVHHHVDLVAVAEYLDDQPDDGPVAISTLFPGQFHDPRVVTATLRSKAVSLRWFDIRGGLILPATPGRLFVPAVTPPDPALEPYLEAHAAPIDRVELRPDDFDPAIEVYEWDGPAALADAAAAMGEATVCWSPAAAFPPEEPLAGCTPLTPPIPFGDRLRLLGYSLRTPQVPPGGVVEVVTLWETTGPAPEEVMLFTHLLDPDGSVVAQADRLDVPAWNWQAGEAFLQVHRFSLPGDLSPGLYVPEVGAYLRRDPSIRLPVSVGPGEAQDRVLLTVVEVVEP